MQTSFDARPLHGASLTDLMLGRFEDEYLPAAIAPEQLSRNAVMHRTYEGTSAPVQVYWFDDRIEINSPGGPHGVVTAETFAEPGAVDYRNPILAEAMRVLGLVQRYGFGIPAAQRELRAAGQGEPEFRVTPHRVHCTVYARRH